MKDREKTGKSTTLSKYLLVELIKVNLFKNKIKTKLIHVGRNCIIWSYYYLRGIKIQKMNIIIQS